MLETTEIRRHANGSIDVGHYVKVGRHLHGQAFREAARSVAVKLRQLWAAMTMRLRQYSSPMDRFLDVVPAE